VVGKSDDGLLYKLRHCQTGKPQRSQIHANRLKLCNEDRDIFYAKNKIVSEGVSDDQPSQRDTDAPNTDDELDEDWYIMRNLGRAKSLDIVSEFLY